MAPIRHYPTLSDDLISEILVRVPVKSLVRFKSVCKTWLSLIKHPAFVKSQLLHVKTDQALINCQYVPGRENKFALLNVHSVQIVAYPNFSYPRSELKSVPYYKLIGSSNGIVCVAASIDYFDKDIVYLWNPAIRQYKIIPYSVCLDIPEEALGFGYDEIDHDFKIVRVVKFGWPSSFRAEVYSANTNVWRKVPDPTEFAMSYYFDLCIKGFLCATGDYGMLAFDLNKEVLNCAIKLPVICDDVEDEPRLIEFDKSIVVIVMMDDILNDDSKIKMWMLDDDACLGGVGVEASWTPMFITSIGWPASIVHGFFISNRDLLLMVIDDIYCYVWISCDVYKKEAKIIPLSIDKYKHNLCHYIYKYKESLVIVPGFRQVNWYAGADVNF